MYVDDTFTRTSTNTWGSAPIGGAYTLQGTAADYDVTAGLGTIVVPTAGTTRSALLNTPSAADVDVSFRVRTDKVAVGGAQFIYAVVRRNGTNEYRVKLRMAPNGAVFVSASTLINNVETTIGSRGPGTRPDPHRQRPDALPRAGERRQPDDPAHPRLGRCGPRADDLAVHPDQQQRQPAGRRSTRPAHLRGLICDQHATAHQLRRPARNEHPVDQPATGLLDRVHGSDRCRGRRHQPRCQCHGSGCRHDARLLGHRSALRHHHQQLDRCLQRHAVGDQLGHLQHRHHRQRRHADRHRQLHLDGDRAERQSATGLQHRVHAIAPTPRVPSSASMPMPRIRMPARRSSTRPPVCPPASPSTARPVSSAARCRQPARASTAPSSPSPTAR